VPADLHILSSKRELNTLSNNAHIIGMFLYLIFRLKNNAPCPDLYNSMSLAALLEKAIDHIGDLISVNKHATDKIVS
jgi:hypothetical protein